MRYAGWTGASVVNTALVSPATHPDGPGAGRQGEQVSQGASRTASEQDFVRTAEHLRKAGRVAADLGVKIAIEVHQGSIADNSTATLHLLDLVGLDNVGANPDLGNIYWHYEQPEETCRNGDRGARAAGGVLALQEPAQACTFPSSTARSSRACRCPTATSTTASPSPPCATPGYDGYLAIEGAREGDQLSQDRRGVEYVNVILKELSEG